jgi:hypothetical protein
MLNHQLVESYHILIHGSKAESNMEMIVMLYVPELTEEFHEYLKGVLSIVAAFEGLHDRDIGEEIEEASKKFQNEFSGLLEKLGYS